MGNSNSRARRPCGSVADQKEESRSTPSTIRGRLSHLAQSSTKRLSKIKFKRKDSAKSQTKAFVDVISHWKPNHVDALLKEFEASKVLLQLSEKADLARPQLLSIGRELLQSSHNDCTIRFKDHCLPVHSFLARARLALLPPAAADGSVSIDGLLPPLVNINHLQMFLHWLYTDEWSSGDEAVLQQLRSSLGSVHDLPDDLLRAEHVASQYGDLEISLVREVAGEGVHTTGANEARVRLDSSLVASRSPVLARLIRDEEGGEKGRKLPLVLDESVLPRAFLPVVVRYLYTDTLQLNLVPPRAVCTSSLSEARAVISGHSPHSFIHRAAHLVHIARFLGLDRLAQLCEDVLHSELSLSTAVPLLQWARDGGSHWIERMAKAEIIKDFARFALSSDLFLLPSTVMEELLASQFVQATEVDILEGVIRWGEHELLKRLEMNEPNVVADTVHSVSRRGIKRSEMDSRQLRQILSPLSPHIRVDYCLPPFHQTLEWAYQRGVLDRGSLRDLVVCPSTAEIDPDLHWHSIPDDAEGPRLYLPYYQVVSDTLAGPSTSKDAPSISAFPSTSGGGGGARPLIDEVEIKNGLPHLVGEEEFQRMAARIRAAVEQEDAEGRLSRLPRLFHRRAALHLIACRVMRESAFLEEAARVFIRGSAPFAPPSDGSSSSEEGPPPDLLPPSHGSPEL